MPESESVRVPRSPCPHCGYITNSAGRLGEPMRPKQGDLSVCLGCGEVSQYGPRLKLRRVPARVLALLTSEEQAELRQVQTAARALIAAQVRKSAGRCNAPECGGDCLECFNALAVRR